MEIFLLFVFSIALSKEIASLIDIQIMPSDPFIFSMGGFSDPMFSYLDNKAPNP